MEYATYGKDTQWNELLKNGDKSKTSNGIMQIKSNLTKPTKRKLTQEDMGSFRCANCLLVENIIIERLCNS